ncbi:MAG TPA: hypothetical protein VEY30_08665, partial [Myxococcaceae bacterium]|nr:hypothetical protein [Myxococcaceae bacterium]
AGPLPLSILALDAAATTSMDEEVDARTTYPDGSLRMLRTLEWSLRFQWAFRRVWMEKRNRMFLKPLLVKVLGLFCESLRRLVAGSITGIPLVGVVLAKQATTQATELSVSPSADLKNIQAGHLAVVHGDRPTVALVLGQGTRGLENLLAISPLNVSVEADARLPGISGLVAPGTVVNAGPVSITSEELILGRAAAGAHADGRVQEVVALSSKLSLVLGKAGSALGLTPPSVAAPYESASAWALNAPVDAAATRLFLQQVPSASGSGTGGRIPVARPGELMLIRGADEEGRWWQGVVTVDRVDILKGAEARSEDEVTGTATPPCCGDDDEVMVVTLRSIQLPKGLVREATLRRDFAGFGGPSLATGVVLPKELDTGTASLEVVDNGVTKVVLRDAELRAAHALLKSWTGMRL